MRRTLNAVDDESQRDEMNAAIRAQRERGAVPRSMLPPEDELPERPSPASEPRALEPEPKPERPTPASEPRAPEPEPEPDPEPDPEPPKRGLIDRLFGRRDG